MPGPEPVPGAADKPPSLAQPGHPRDGHCDPSLVLAHAAAAAAASATAHTHPLFPPLPQYGPPSLRCKIRYLLFRASSSVLGLAFLAVIVLGALVTAVRPAASRALCRIRGRDPDADRPFYQEERSRATRREQEARAWKASTRHARSRVEERRPTPRAHTEEPDHPMAGEVRDHARRVGLDMEAFLVQTEDGFIIDLWHVYDPTERRQPLSGGGASGGGAAGEEKRARFPVLLMHGLLQSAAAYCCNGDDSLAFWLCKSGFDVWLGNSRCGLRPRHVTLKCSDPAMWCWNIRQMGVFDLPAFVSQVRRATGFGQVGLVCHSQGTAQALVALAREQRPDLGAHISVLCALAPAAYAGPLIDRLHFRFMRAIPSGLFRLTFGIHAFIPIMMVARAVVPTRLYGRLAYTVFSYMFSWSDARWDRGLRGPMFRSAPVYVSAESMRWWLGQECFARHRCILATREAAQAEEREEVQAAQAEEREEVQAAQAAEGREEVQADREREEDRKHSHHLEAATAAPAVSATAGPLPTDGCGRRRRRRQSRGATAWFDGRVPPFALWVADRDELVDGRRLLRRFERGREPHVRVVHSRIIPEYEHLDVIWAMDAPDQVFTEVREVLWKTAGEEARARCRVPVGCEEVGPWTAEEHPAAAKGEDESDGQSSSSGASGGA